MNEVGREGPGWKVWVCWRVVNKGLEGCYLGLYWEELERQQQQQKGLHLHF